MKLQFVPALLFFHKKTVCAIAVHIPVTLYVSLQPTIHSL